MSTARCVDQDGRKKRNKRRKTRVFKRAHLVDAGALLGGVQRGEVVKGHHLARLGVDLHDVVRQPVAYGGVRAHVCGLLLLFWVVVTGA